jgi:N-acetylmuramidase
MTGFRKELTDLIRPHLGGKKLSTALVDSIDDLLDRAGVPRDGPDPAPSAVTAPAPPPGPPASPADVAPGSPPPAPPGTLDVAALRAWLGLPAAGAFDDAAKQALRARLANPKAPALTDADFDRVAAELGVLAKMIRAVTKIEAPRGAFDAQGRPSILYEKHVFARNSGGRFNASNPVLSAKNWQPGTYGPFSAQYQKLADACALDPGAAFKACSWGAFQVLGENAVDIGYASALDMAMALTVSEAAHLDCFIRFIKSKKLVAALQACKPGDPASCIPFVRGYNGAGYATNKYHVNLANAAR